MSSTEKTLSRKVTLRQAPEGSPNFCFGLYDSETDECVEFVQSDWEYASLASSLGWSPSFFINPRKDDCVHDGTDGTVDCECGATVSQFLSHAFDWLVERKDEEFDYHE